MYNSNFLGRDFPLSMPNFSPILVGNILRLPELREGIYVDYINFTVIYESRTTFANCNCSQY